MSSNDKLKSTTPNVHLRFALSFTLTTKGERVLLLALLRVVTVSGCLGETDIIAIHGTDHDATEVRLAV